MEPKSLIGTTYVQDATHPRFGHQVDMSEANLTHIKRTTIKNRIEKIDRVDDIKKIETIANYPYQQINL